MNNFILKFILLLLSFSAFAQNNQGVVKPIKKPKTIKYPSGLEYTLTQKGNGIKPQLGDKVTIHYTGKLTNDSIFDTSVPRGVPISFKLGFGEMIKGVEEAIYLMQVGDKAKIKIPPSLGYGAIKKSGIPANSTLLFELELVDVYDGIRPYDVSGKDTIQLEGGLKYILVKKDTTGTLPKKGDQMTIHYTIFDMNGRWTISTIEKNQPITFKIGKNEVVKGLDLVTSKLRTHEKARIIIPAEMAFGPESGKKLFIYDVEVLNIREIHHAAPFDTTGKELIKTPSELKYYVISKGNGKKAEIGKKVGVQYTGYYEDGRIFDSSVERNSPFFFTLGKKKVIEGWEEGISMMQEGDKFRFIIPYKLAYGEEGMGPIPPKSNLIFDIELIIVSN